MTTYSDEINVYNPEAIQQGIEDARDYYITSVTNDGVWVTPHDAKPVNGQAASTTRGWHIADALEYFRGTVRYIKAWLNGSTPTVRLGQDNAGHADVTPDGLEVFTDASTSVAEFGDTVRIGNPSKCRLEQGASSFRQIDKNDFTYLSIEDHRGNNDSAIIKETRFGDGSTTTFPMLNSVIAGISAIDGSNSSNTAVWNISNSYCKFSTAPSNGARLTFTYESDSDANKSFTFGSRTQNSTIGSLSFSEGEDNTAAGYASHAEGVGNSALGEQSHVEGGATVAKGSYSHAEGFYAIARGKSSHAEGDNTQANGYSSHAEGYYCTAESSSHAEGHYSEANGGASHAQNYFTIAAKNAQTTLGTYNKEDTSATTTHPSGTAGYGKYAAIIGNGTSDSARSNALAVTWAGDVECGKVNGVDVTAIGTVKSNALSAKSIPNNGWTSAGSVTLEAGTWVVTYGGQFDNNASGLRGVLLNTSATVTRYAVTITAASGSATRENGVLVLTPAAQTTYNLYAYQSSGSALNFTGYIQAVRLK